MKGDDLTTTLHQKYNTLTLTLQDPEAFHHDVYELSQQATTATEFHKLMADRQQQRITELTQSMESLAVEIIANPALMGTEQWKHAVQLFRTKSYDSIVRYFASYLPEDYLDSQHGSSTTSSNTTSFTDISSVESSEPCIITKAEAATDIPAYLDDDDFFPHGPVMAVKHDAPADEHAPLSPPHSEGSPSEISDSASYSTGPPSRSMSFSGSESGHLPSGFMLRDLSKDSDDTISQSDDGETIATSLCDSVESVSSLDSVDNLTEHSYTYSDDLDDDLPSTQYPEDYFDMVEEYESKDTPDSDTPTPRAVEENFSYMDCKSASAQCVAASIRRTTSLKSYVRSRADGLDGAKLRRGPDLASNKIHKFPADLLRRRSMAGRRRVD